MVVCTAPLAEIVGNRDASGRVAKWAIELAPHTILYQPRTAIKSQVLADFLIESAETQYLPPVLDSTHWLMHFDGLKMRIGLGAGIVLTSPKGDKLRYTLQIHFVASNNVVEYEVLVHGLQLAKEIGICRVLCYGDSDLVVHQSSGHWDAKDANMASYRFLVQQISGYFDGCEFLHGLDMVGPLKTARGGMTHMFVAVDKFTKCIEAKPIKKLNGLTAVTFIVDITIRYSVPHSIITDNGTNFAKGALAHFCAAQGIRLDLASVAHLQSNGQVVQANGLIMSGIKP
ncbi:unnamed protein product [Triticum aestivum]|uniref:Integrase catalytic domain-containing protein n=1 Tax=Triticum aestivum TaxID=4565 RepID=A0A7H4LCP0_WHEAT|nr:unnamed protein product [Triticum aestivum]